MFVHEMVQGIMYVSFLFVAISVGVFATASDNEVCVQRFILTMITSSRRKFSVIILIDKVDVIKRDIQLY